ncbi:hypothetical protein TVAG_432830 [Trichomonas vaginalis G3]|uniref:Ras-GAP domain-containing protein n=1 Tax=Trichomonas vaginalis (strain ATCC PRA-98 / G3) TaxID=412133 RepID=A2DIS4_TRIV3|nr:GTPase activation domain, GAP family [Trichomonas vaginalis G3]EAY19687.1 hypothetical protein TVAG_432830 [Trichomonas vaginalis G3]KAI5521293.1 GTPase activation domain, GAP family [Trichomonas vaginalis G3]|eukprot:XP_001580673.1 hypothetical protein [Trichomonas vaginalis G3]
MIYAPLEYTSKRKFATALVNAFADRLTVNFYINSLIALYFMQEMKPQEIMRSDSLLTNSLGAVREIVAPHFFENFYEYLTISLKDAQTPEEVLRCFIDQVKTLVIPGTLKWICKLLYLEAKRKFPEGDSPYYAVTGFFFLRSLGPFFTQFEDKKKLQPILSLFNLSKKTEIDPFIDEFKEFLNNLIIPPPSKIMIARPKPQDVVDSMKEFIELIKNDYEQILKHVTNTKAPGTNPCLWFTRRIFDLCSEQFDSEGFDVSTLNQ